MNLIADIATGVHSDNATSIAVEATGSESSGGHDHASASHASVPVNVPTQMISGSCVPQDTFALGHDNFTSFDFTSGYVDQSATEYFFAAFGLPPAELSFGGSMPAHADAYASTPAIPASTLQPLPVTTTSLPVSVYPSTQDTPQQPYFIPHTGPQYIEDTTHVQVPANTYPAFQAPQHHAPPLSHPTPQHSPTIAAPAPTPISIPAVRQRSASASTTREVQLEDQSLMSPASSPDIPISASAELKPKRQKRNSKVGVPRSKRVHTL